jgi:hypothetical protein
LHFGGTAAHLARFRGKEEHAMQTGFLELTTIAVLMLSSLIWIQPF